MENIFKGTIFRMITQPIIYKLPTTTPLLFCIRIECGYQNEHSTFNIANKKILQ